MSGLEELQAQYLFQFSYHLGIQPWQWDQMEPRHVYELARCIDLLEQQT